MDYAATPQQWHGRHWDRQRRACQNSTNSGRTDTLDPTAKLGNNSRGKTYAERHTSSSSIHPRSHRSPAAALTTCPANSSTVFSPIQSAHTCMKRSPSSAGMLTTLPLSRPPASTRPCASLAPFNNHNTCYHRNVSTRVHLPADGTFFHPVLSVPYVYSRANISPVHRNPPLSSIYLRHQ